MPRRILKSPADQEHESTQWIASVSERDYQVGLGKVHGFAAVAVDGLLRRTQACQHEHRDVHQHVTMYNVLLRLIKHYMLVKVWRRSCLRRGLVRQGSFLDGHGAKRYGRNEGI